MMPSFARAAGNVMGASPARPEPIRSPMRPVGNPARPVMGGPRMAQPMTFKKGGVVRKGGVAKVHKGEKITTKGKYRAAKAALGGKKKTSRLIEAAGKEMKNSPPKILAKTARKSGAKQANKQRVAIMLSKARAAGANIPEKS